MSKERAYTTLLQKIEPVEGRSYPSDEYREYMKHESRAHTLQALGEVPGIIRPLARVAALLARNEMPKDRNDAYFTYMALRQEAFANSDTKLDAVISEQSIRRVAQLGSLAIGQFERIEECLEDTSGRFRLALAPDELVYEHLDDTVQSNVVFHGTNPAAYEQFTYNHLRPANHEAWYPPHTKKYAESVNTHRAIRAELANEEAEEALRRLVFNLKRGLAKQG